ncbi:MAG TPA: hypothetical protein VNK52_05985 [Hyphomicrobiaceae bacterium]|nr:hypothetical protein [Hyphomicrobiaceae bacterium]
MSDQIAVLRLMGALQARAWSFDGIARVAAGAALLAFSWSAIAPEGVFMSDVGGQREAEGESLGRAATLGGREVQVGAYGGVSYTHPSTVSVENPGKTDLRIDGVNWIGRPFKSPIYYGLRILAWGPLGRLGGMVDFTHAKAISVPSQEATFTGMRNGQPVPPKARVGDVFRHLEFSHGHNLLTLNALVRLGTFLGRVRPYAGVGGGVAIPHTEVGFAGERERTYEYQYAGLAWQALAGIEVRLGRASIFFEYKFTFAPYAVPLSLTHTGGLLVGDLWRQLQAWLSGRAPPGGTLRTTLVTQHAVSGVLVRVAGPQ